MENEQTKEKTGKAAREKPSSKWWGKGRKIAESSGVARKFERWAKRAIFPTSGRGHMAVAKNCVVISFYFIHLFSCLLSDFIIVLFDIK